MRHSILLLLSLITAPLSAQTPCAERALVSGYFSNNVHVYDACTGAFERVLDDQGRIRGPQAVRLGPDGRLYVVSEENGKILRYDGNTLAFIDEFINTGATFKPTGMAFGPDGDVYLGGYLADQVRRYDRSTGALKGTVIATRQAGLDGPDCGMNFGPDGKLYVPGYDSSNVVRFDPATGTVDVAVAARTGGLNKTRAVLFEPGGSSYLVASEGSGHIFRFNLATGALMGTFAQGLGQPAGMNYTGNGKILLASNSGTALKLDAASGANEGPLFNSGSGGLDGSTYANVIPKSASPVVDTTQIGSQYWVVGAGSMSGSVLNLDVVVSANGASFGSAFRPQDVTRKRWGSVRIEFTGCAAGNFSWNSTGTDSAGFGSGSYAITPIVPTAFTQSCQSTGFANAGAPDYVNGSWWGGETRNGEGLFIARAPDGLVTLAWFTYRPAAAR